LFRQPTAWEKYRWQIVLVGTALLLQAALIGVLLHENRRRRRAEASASKLESELAHMNRVATASRPNRAAWGWACRFANQSSRPMKVGLR
jgi:hypothetical protein